MKKLDNLLPFLTLLLIFAMFLIIGNSSFGATNAPLCTFKMKPSTTGKVHQLIPAGTYRILSKRTSAGYADGSFQRLQRSKHGKVWKSFTKAEGGNRLAVNLHHQDDRMTLYFTENKSKPGACVLSGSIHAWM